MDFRQLDALNLAHRNAPTIQSDLQMCGTDPLMMRVFSCRFLAIAASGGCAKRAFFAQHSRNSGTLLTLRHHT